MLYVWTYLVARLVGKSHGKALIMAELAQTNAAIAVLSTAVSSLVAAYQADGSNTAAADTAAASAISAVTAQITAVLPPAPAAVVEPAPAATA